MVLDPIGPVANSLFQMAHLRLGAMWPVRQLGSPQGRSTAVLGTGKLDFRCFSGSSALVLGVSLAYVHSACGPLWGDGCSMTPFIEAPLLEVGKYLGGPIMLSRGLSGFYILGGKWLIEGLSAARLT